MDFPIKLKKSDKIEVLTKQEPYTNSDDKKGHSWLLAARCPTWFGRVVDIMKEKKSSPYKTQSDVIRDAIFVGLAVLSVRYSSGGSWQVEAATDEIAGDIRRTARIAAKVKDLGSQLDVVLKDDKRKSAKFLREYIKAVSEGENASDYWEQMKRNETIKFIMADAKITFPKNSAGSEWSSEDSDSDSDSDSEVDDGADDEKQRQ